MLLVVPLLGAQRPLVKSGFRDTKCTRARWEPYIYQPGRLERRSSTRWADAWNAARSTVALR
jgi:hypothetical protein